MTTSYNGWPASPSLAAIHAGPFSAAGVSFPAGVRQGDVEVVFTRLVEQLAARVEKPRKGWCWGHNFRPNRNDPSTLSCHASATALDHNAPAHPNGVKGTWSAKQLRVIRRITEIELERVVRCGEFFHGTTDGMHFEICADEAAVHRVAVKLRGHKERPAKKVVRKVRTVTRRRPKALPHDGVVSLARLHRGASNGDVREVQRILNRWYPTLDLAEDGTYGRQTVNALARVRVALKVRGDMGKASTRRRVLRKLGFKVVA